MSSKATVSLALVAILVSGCLAVPSTTTGSGTNNSLPDKPTVLTEWNVSNYTTAYEAAKIYDQYAEYNPTDDRISCRSDTRVTIDSTFVMNVQCTGGIGLENGEHADVSASTHYYVSETTTKRIGTDDTRSVRYREYQSNGLDLTSFEVVNLANEPASVGVELIRDDSESPLRFDYGIDSHRSVVQVGLPFEYGTTRGMRIQVDNATTTAQFTSERVEFASPTVIYILPDGRIRVTLGPSRIR